MRIGIMLEAVPPSHVKANVRAPQFFKQIIVGRKKINRHLLGAWIQIVRVPVGCNDFLATVQQRLYHMPADIAPGPSYKNSF